MAASISLAPQNDLLRDFGPEVYEELPEALHRNGPRLGDEVLESRGGKASPGRLSEEIGEAFGQSIPLLGREPAQLAREILSRLQARFGPRVWLPAFLAERRGGKHAPSGDNVSGLVFAPDLPSTMR